MTDPTTRVRAILDAATGPSWNLQTLVAAETLSRNLLPAALDVVEQAAEVKRAYLANDDKALLGACADLCADLDAYDAKEREVAS